MNNMYKVIILFSLLVYGCKTRDIENKNINQSIDSFNMNIYTKEGNKMFSIKSPISQYDNKENTIKLKDTTIHIYKDNKTEYIINSDNSKLLNNNKLLEMNGNVIVKSLLQKQDQLYANSFKWNINNSEYLLKGNVKFENNTVTLSSNKAILNKGMNVIKFFNPVKYYIKNNNNKNSYVINSENAFYNINTKSVTFNSYEERVKSKIFF